LLLIDTGTQKGHVVAFGVGSVSRLTASLRW